MLRQSLRQIVIPVQLATSGGHVIMTLLCVIAGVWLLLQLLQLQVRQSPPQQRQVEPLQPQSPLLLLASIPKQQLPLPLHQLHLPLHRVRLCVLPTLSSSLRRWAVDLRYLMGSVKNVHRLTNICSGRVTRIFANAKQSSLCLPLLPPRRRLQVVPWSAQQLEMP